MKHFTVIAIMALFLMGTVALAEDTAVTPAAPVPAADTTLAPAADTTLVPAPAVEKAPVKKEAGKKKAKGINLPAAGKAGK